MTHEEKIMMYLLYEVEYQVIQPDGIKAKYPLYHQSDVQKICIKDGLYKLLLKPLDGITDEEIMDISIGIPNLDKLPITMDLKLIEGGCINQCFFGIVIELIKRGYDVFGLIADGFAVDYKTLKKEA